ncbi:MAG TPA: hypothetical protein ENG27_00285, partial [Candidatus Bathyarchaeota archaeon]|nr:hypothetical protein [Candidatus Bathyarchaeota archaeon]
MHSHRRKPPRPRKRESPRRNIKNAKQHNREKQGKTKPELRSARNKNREEGKKLPRRERRRYLLIEVDGDVEIDGKTLIREIQRAVLRLFGEYGASKTKTQLIEYDKITKQAIIRCNHKSLP